MNDDYMTEEEHTKLIRDRMQRRAEAPDPTDAFASSMKGKLRPTLEQSKTEKQAHGS